MDHSIAAKYAARPAARFVRPSTRVRERRLGLRPSGSFRRRASASTVLHGPEVASARPSAGQLARDPPGRSRSASAAAGRVPQVAMEWARSGRPGAVRRPGAASAPWPA